jgi:hypothetical protein
MLEASGSLAARFFLTWKRSRQLPCPSSGEEECSQATQARLSSVRAGSVPQRSSMGIGGHQRSPPVQRNPQVAGPPGHAAGMVQTGESDRGPEGREFESIGHHVCRMTARDQPAAPRGQPGTLIPLRRSRPAPSACPVCLRSTLDPAGESQRIIQRALRPRPARAPPVTARSTPSSACRRASRLPSCRARSGTQTAVVSRSPTRW